MFVRIVQIIFIMIIIQFAIYANGDFTISGKVISESDSQPLVGVEVFLTGSSIGTTTNSNGEYTIKNVEIGTYIIRFSLLGYATINKNINVPSTESSGMIIKMKEAVINLNDVVVTGNPFLAETKDLSQSVVSLSKLDLIIRNSGTIGEELNFQPGIAMRSNGIATGRPVIRGFSNNKVLMLEDGLRMGDLSNASDDHSVSNDGSEPEKIEVLEGPSSLLYGSNAIGGVINIITDAIPASVQQGLNGEILAQGSSVNNEYLGNLHLNYGTGILSMHGKFFKRKGDDYKISAGSKTFNSDLNTNGSQIGLSLHPDWGMAGLSFTEFNNSYGLPASPGADEIVFINMQKKQYRLATEVTNINSFINSLSLKAGYLDYNHKEISRIDGAVGTEFGLKTYSADLSFAHNPIFENSNGVFGFYGLVQNYDVIGTEALTPNADYQNYAFYFLEKFKFDKIGFSFGARYELNKIKFPQAVLTDSSFSKGENNFNLLSASAGVIYSIYNDASVFINLANGFRAPSIEELSSYAIHEALASFDIGNRNLGKENSFGIDAGLRLHSDNYYFELTGYFNRVDGLIYRQPQQLFYSEEVDPVSGNLIGFNNLKEGLRVYKYEQGNANVYGFETKLNYEIIKGLTATLVSDYVRAVNQTTEENVSQIPPFRVSVEVRYATPLQWYGVTCNLVNAQNNVAPNEEPTKGYGLIGIYSGLKILTGEFAHIINLKISNLFDLAYKDHLSAIKDFTYMPGRNIQLSYKFLF
ncbi:MAG TPA: hypothetical protein DHV28_07815 [Ignavibacteriales bacterium]|nr:hypothetical protein [Ignavibacteriales bacterium]